MPHSKNEQKEKSSRTKVYYWNKDNESQKKSCLWVFLLLIYDGFSLCTYLHFLVRRKNMSGKSLKYVFFCLLTFVES
jgi:hypothetical protein